MLYSRMLNERNRLEEEINSLDQLINNLPPGNLFFSHNGKYIKWYQSDGHQKTYISRKNLELAQQLAIKKYLSAQKEDILQELCAIDYYLNLKISEAKKLIRTEKYTISQISDMLMFSCIHHFSRSFKRFTGITPSEYKKKIS